MLISAEKAQWSIGDGLGVGFGDSWHLPPLLCTSVIVNSCLYVLLDSMAVAELVVLIEDSFDKRSADEL